MPSRTGAIDPVETAIKNVLTSVDGLEECELLRGNIHAQGAVRAALRNYARTVTDLRIRVPADDFDYRDTAISIALKQHDTHSSLALAFRDVSVTLARVLNVPENKAESLAQTLLLLVGRQIDDLQQAPATSVTR